MLLSQILDELIRQVDSTWCHTDVVMSLLREVRMSHSDQLSGTPDSCTTVRYDSTSPYVQTGH